MDLEPSRVAARLEEIESVLKVGPSSRLVECARVLRASAVAQERSGVLHEPEVQALGLALQDATLIVDAFDGLTKPTALEGAEQRLRRACGGPALEVPARGADKERDELWELWLASRLRLRHFEPQFGDDLLPSLRRPDLIITVSGIRLAVEAKRPRSLAPLGDRITKAVSQIRASVESGHAEAGFIAADVSFAIEQHAQLGAWAVADGAGVIEVRRTVAKDLGVLQLEVAATIAALPGARHVVGATLMAMPALVHESPRRLRLVRQFLTVTYPNGSARPIAALATVGQACFSDGSLPPPEPSADRTKSARPRG